MSIPNKEIQIYCERCRASSWINIDMDANKSHSGIMKKSVIHGDHVAVIDLDGNGSVRRIQAIDIEFSPLNTLIEDVAQGMHYLVTDAKIPVVINVYTSNQPFAKLIQSIIVEMFKQATSNRVEDTYKFVATTHEKQTTLRSDKVLLSIGPYTKLDENFDSDPQRGIVLDIKEAEKNKLDIEATLSKYTWAAIIVQKEKKEGYVHALSSLFEQMETPFFIESLNNHTLRELFDFIFAITLQT